MTVTSVPIHGAERTDATLLGGPRPRSERAEEGRALRAAVPRRAHAEWTVAADRRDPVAVLQAQDATRRADLLPIRYGRMVASPWSFLRGSAAVMAQDLASMPRVGPTVQLCGDAHLANFGMFAAPDRRLLFDLNDFDETAVGPFEWDVKRLAASAVVAARQAGMGRGDARACALGAVRGYRTTVAGLAEADTMAAWYFRVEVDRLVDRLSASARTAAQRARKSAVKRTSLRAFDRLTAVVDGERRIVPDPPLVVPVPRDVSEETVERLRSLLTTYRASLPIESRRLLGRFRGVDVAQKVVGVGSVGMRSFIMLLLGGDGEPLFLQIKESGPSVLAPYVGADGHAHDGHAHDEHGRRVVEGQRLIQGAGDVLLGWTAGLDETGRAASFYVRQLHDRKGSVAVEELDPSGLATYAALCGAVLARAHARSGDAALIAGYLGRGDGFDHAVATFAERYGDVVVRDHAALVDAVSAGRVEVRTNV